MQPVKPGSRISQEVRNRFSAARKGVKRDPAIGRKISAAKLGNVSEKQLEHLKKLKKINRGKVRTPEQRENYRQAALKAYVDHAESYQRGLAKRQAIYVVRKAV